MIALAGRAWAGTSGLPAPRGRRGLVGCNVLKSYEGVQVTARTRQQSPVGAHRFQRYGLRDTGKVTLMGRRSAGTLPTRTFCTLT